MNVLQEPKYTLRDGKIVNRQSGEAIPDDEPIFILRARDVHASPTLKAYRKLISSGTKDHYAAVYARIFQFDLWKQNHPERMKEPDTILTNDWERCVEGAKPMAETTEVITDFNEKLLDPTPDAEREL